MAVLSVVEKYSVRESGEKSSSRGSPYVMLSHASVASMRRVATTHFTTFQPILPVVAACGVMQND
jgi:hypothetical protein